MGIALRHLSLASALAAAVMAACYTGPSANDGLAPNGAPEVPADVAPPTAAEQRGLPCDVAKLLRDHCTKCHGREPQGNAVTSLVSREDLMSTLQGKLLGPLSVERMRDAEFPMPPEGNLADDQVAMFAQWVEGGMLAGSCAESVADDGDAAAVAPIELTCTSGTYWTRGNDESPLMKPGSECIHCHATGESSSQGGVERDDDDDDFEEGPRYEFAGTVYLGSHDENDCYGSGDTGTKVVLTGADGQTLELPINKAGNFYTKKSLAAPVKAQVVNATGTRTMKEPVEDGDCNRCHTAESITPGRIIPKL